MSKSSYGLICKSSNVASPLRECLIHPTVFPVNVWLHLHNIIFSYSSCKYFALFNWGFMAEEFVGSEGGN